jgi:hypothetical protein
MKLSLVIAGHNEVENIENTVLAFNGELKKQDRT